MHYSDYHVFTFILKGLQGKIKGTRELFHRSKHITEMEVELSTLRPPIQGNGTVGTSTGTRRISKLGGEP
ncbi:hypothetical protein EAE99_008052 [Botrytis elliptica]|nr:hypothetical protein EAE99_008052 [Botrytis elliptica]